MSYANRVLRVNLTTRKVISLALPEQLKRDYLGGRGFAVKLLYELLPKDTGPLSPENLLIFAAGALDGTVAAAAASLTVAARSPLTGLLGLDTTSGLWASELKMAGYDLIFIQGRADELVYLEIEDGRVEIKPAAWLRNRGTHETTDLLQERLGAEFRIAAIGPAGENEVLYASIICDHLDKINRTGLGAVMGSKNLKAIAVRGTQAIGLADYSRFLAATKQEHLAVKADPLYAPMSRYGTTELFNYAQEAGVLSVHNGQNGLLMRVPGLSRANFDNFAHEPGKNLVNRPCSYCVMPCKAYIESARPDEGNRRNRPHYLTIASLGPRLGISSVGALVEANHLCEELGLDPTSLGGSLAFLVECSQRGLFEHAALEWGDADRLMELIRATAYKTGLGGLLAQGVRHMSEQIEHSREYALEVKGLELPALDGRAAKAHALAMAIGNRGGDTALHMPQFELLGKTEEEAEEMFISPATADPLDWHGKASMVVWHEYFAAALDASGICKHYAFTAYALTPGGLAELLTYATGTQYREMDVMMLGERISTVERMFNLRFGMNPLSDDTLPRRLLSQPLGQGQAQGQTIQLARMLQEYYMLRGFTEDGLLRIETLQNLGIISEKVMARQ